MYYNVTNPVYMNITIETYATTVDSSLEGITYLKLNQAGNQLQIIDMSSRSQLTQTSLIIFNSTSALRQEVLNRQTQTGRLSMSENLYEWFSFVTGFNFQGVDR